MCFVYEAPDQYNADSSQKDETCEPECRGTSRCFDVGRKNKCVCKKRFAYDAPGRCNVDSGGNITRGDISTNSNNEGDGHNNEEALITGGW